jgi:hypothetical protein
MLYLLKSLVLSKISKNYIHLDILNMLYFLTYENIKILVGIIFTKNIYNAGPSNGYFDIQAMH